MDFVFLPCHVLEALASKKKSKGKKEPKAAKPQGRNSIHHLCNANFFFSIQFFIFALFTQFKTLFYKLYSWRWQRWHVWATQVGRRGLLALRWEKRTLQWRERSVWRRWRGKFHLLHSVHFEVPETCSYNLMHALWCPFQGDLFSEAPKPPVSEERKVRKESLKSTGRTDSLKKNVQGIL